MDLAIEDVLEERTKVPVELGRERIVNAQERGAFEIAHQQEPERLQGADRERQRADRGPRSAAGADQSTGLDDPGVRLLRRAFAALDAMTELRPEAGAIEQVQVEPAADEGRDVTRGQVA